MAKKSEVKMCVVGSHETKKVHHHLCTMCLDQFKMKTDVAANNFISGVIGNLHVRHILGS